MTPGCACGRHAPREGATSNSSKSLNECWAFAITAQHSTKICIILYLNPEHKSFYVLKKLIDISLIMFHHSIQKMVKKKNRTLQVNLRFKIVLVVSSKRLLIHKIRRTFKGGGLKCDSLWWKRRGVLNNFDVRLHTKKNVFVKKIGPPLFLGKLNCYDTIRIFVRNVGRGGKKAFKIYCWNNCWENRPMSPNNSGVTQPTEGGGGGE